MKVITECTCYVYLLVSQLSEYGRKWVSCSCKILYFSVIYDHTT